MRLGMVLNANEEVATGVAPTWSEIRRQALHAEAVGFDTVWMPDELLWETDAWPRPAGFWECVAITAAVAEATTDVAVGTWVLSALHRNPGLTAKAVTTLDEISGGRIVFGFGAGHSGRQGAAFGYPPDLVVARYEEALQIVVPLLRGARVDFAGTHHRAGLSNRPTGPRPRSIPIMLGGHGPRTIRLAAQHADVWSAYATNSSQPKAFTDMLRMVDHACEQQDRDPRSLGRSIGVNVIPEGFEAPPEWGVSDPLTGPARAIAEKVHEFASLGVTSLEFMVWPTTAPAYEAVGEVLAALDA